MKAKTAFEVSQPKMGPTQFKAEVERLKAAGKMPSLEEVLSRGSASRIRSEDSRRTSGQDEVVTIADIRTPRPVSVNQACRPRVVIVS